MFGNKVIIPQCGRKKVLQLLHDSHLGIGRMYGAQLCMARNYVWRPGIDKDIDETVKTCTDCLINLKVPLHPKTLPGKLS